MSKEIASYISEKTHTPITIQGVDISPFKSIILKGLYAEDFQKDTLLYVHKLDIKIDSFNLKKQNIYVNTLTLNKTYFNLYEGKKQNIEIFIESLTQKKQEKTADTIQKPWTVKVKNIDIENSFFRYKTANYIPKQFGMNYDNIYVSKLNLQARNIQLIGDSIWFNVKNFSCYEQSGFEIKKLQSKMWITDKQWGLSNIKVRTPHSFLKAKHLYFNYVSGKKYWANFVKKMQLDFLITSSRVSLLDVAYFNESLLGFRENAIIKGHFYGTIENLKGRNLDLTYGENTSVKGRFYLNGLPNLANTYLQANFKQLTTTIADIQKIYIPSYTGGYFKFPEFLNNLGIIKYKGKFNGFFNDFVCNGNFKTDLGDFRTDILFKPQEGTDKIEFNGDLESQNFNLGGLIEQEKVGNITMNVAVNGYTNTLGTEGNIKGNIRALEFYDYNYENVTLNAFFGKSIFDGKLSVKDPNINFDFAGKVDFSKKIPTMKFSSNLLKSKLFPLHLNSEDKDSHLTFSIDANLQGNDFNNINGTLNVRNVIYKNSLGELPLKQLHLKAVTSATHKKINVDSDYAAIDVDGNYNVEKLTKTITNLMYHYLPAYTNDTTYMQKDTINKLNFKIHLKNTDNITKVLYPEIKIAENTNLQGNIDAIQQNYELLFNTNKLEYDGRLFKNFQLNINADNKQFCLKSKIDKLNLFSDYGLYNLSPKINIGNNKVTLNLLWNNWKGITYSGAVSAEGKVTKSANLKNKKWDIAINPGTIVMADSVWNITKSRIKSDSSSWTIENFKLKRNNNFLGINGTLSKNKKDSIKMQIRNIPLKNFNFLLLDNNLSAEGIANGDIKLLDFYDTPLVDSDIRVQKLLLNKDTIGDITLHSEWNQPKQKLFIESNVTHRKLKKMELVGDFYPNNNNIAIDILLNKMNIKAISPYLKENISELSGSVSGKLNVTGKIDHPNPKGKIKFNDIKFKVDATQVKYSCTDSVTVASGKVNFNQLKVTDSHNNKAFVKGDITYNDFSNIGMDLTASFENLKVLNSKITENELVYGKAYVSGVGKLWGNINDLNANINIKTENNTSIYIPMDSRGDLEESNFITFVNTATNQTDNTKAIDYNINLFGINVNCDLELTPDAHVQIIFDSKIGDILKANGSGNLKMQVNNNGDFKMYGNYTIKKGSYLFTLQNVINKKFDLEQGGVIEWKGQPYNAQINIDAAYNVKTTLYDLLLNTPYVDKTKKIPVQCKMHLSESLESPAIKFDIDFPTLDQQTQSVLSGLFSSEDEVNKQILSLLVLNRFYTPEYMRATDPEFENKNSSYAVGVTAGELFSNQLSNWLSQISNDFDIGFTWRPGDNITKDEVELALSTQIFNDRVTINGNVGTRNDQTAKSNFVSDVDVNVKLDRSGKLQFKAFSRSNEYLIYEDNKNTQGIGVFYKEDFNTWGELLRKYFRFLKKKDKKKNKKK